MSKFEVKSLYTNAIQIHYSSDTCDSLIAELPVLAGETPSHFVADDPAGAVHSLLSSDELAKLVALILNTMM